MGKIKDEQFKEYVKFWNENKDNDTFENFFDKFSDYAPKIEIGDFDDTVRNGLLFVSCNPSGTDTDFYEQNNKIDYEEVIWYSKKKDTSGFLGALKKFAEHCGYDGNYSKLDVFCVVKKSQDDVEDHYKKHKDVYEEMFDIFVSTVEKLEPKVIVVPNAFVRDLFQNDFSEKIGYDKDQEPNCGGHKAKFGNHETYIFFTSMLSGVRALDVGSRELLEWAVKRHNVVAELKIQEEIIELPRDPALDELKERLVREHEEKEKRARREKWRRILGLGFFFKK